MLWLHLAFPYSTTPLLVSERSAGLLRCSYAPAIEVYRSIEISAPAVRNNHFTTRNSKKKITFPLPGLLVELLLYVKRSIEIGSPLFVIYVLENFQVDGNNDGN